jgi:hypothetical protein
LTLNQLGQLGEIAFPQRFFDHNGGGRAALELGAQIAEACASVRGDAGFRQNSRRHNGVTSAWRQQQYAVCLLAAVHELGSPINPMSFPTKVGTPRNTP